MRRLVLALVAVALVGTSSTLAAQGRRDRDRGLVEVGSTGIRGGFFISGGLGAGRESFKFEDELDYSEPLTKPTLTIRLGGTPNSNVRLGGEIFAWGNEVPETDEQLGGMESFSTIMGTIQFYPAPSQGLYLKGGGGIAMSSFDEDFGPTTTETGFGWTIGAGYEIPVSRKVAIAPTIDFYQGSFGQRNEPTLYERVLNIGVSVTFQTGR